MSTALSSSPGPLLLNLAQLSPLLRSGAWQPWLQLAQLLVPASFLCVTLGKGLHSGPQFPTNPGAALQSQDTRVPIAVAKLGWGRRAGMGCACSVSSSGARRPRPQASQAWLRPPVFQAQAGGEEGGEGREGERGEVKRGEGKGREGRAGGGTEWPIVCVCVRVCTRGGPTQCATCVPDQRGQPGLLTSGSPPGGRPPLPTSVANHSRALGPSGREPGGAAPRLRQELRRPLPPHPARHMTGEGGGGRRAGPPSGGGRRGAAPGPPATAGALPTPWTSPLRPGGAGGGRGRGPRRGGAAGRGRSPPPFL